MHVDPKSSGTVGQTTMYFAYWNAGYADGTTTGEWELAFKDASGNVVAEADSGLALTQ